MGYRNLAACVADLEKHGELVRIEAEIDPHLEAAEVQRRVYQANGPAVYFAKVKGSRFPMVSNLFGTPDRTRLMFRDTLESVKALVRLKTDPAAAMKHPLRNLKFVRTLSHMLPRKSRRGPAIRHQTTLDQLPQLVSWPNDGGPFITLPAVYTEHPAKRSLMQSNLGMYRVQIAGNEYEPNKQIGLHYQIHRSIGVHHAAAIERGERLPVNIFIGGPPALPLSAVMPLPEGLSELTFAGAIGGRAMRMIVGHSPLPIYSEADFTIVGSIDPHATLPEGPFGDHLGYYSNRHEFPVMEVDAVYHREGAIWPFTTVGRPPQEDTSFGEIIHEITGPAIPSVIPGVHAVHAVDAAGVHPLLLAIGSERYVPYAQDRTPQELLTNANAILGQGQLSLAKFLLIAAKEDNPELDIHDIAAYFHHVLERVDWSRDLHFQTKTTIDTLDYSGQGFNQGSKVVIAAAGKPRRELGTEVPSEINWPSGVRNVRVCLPGVLAVETVDDCLCPPTDSTIGEKLQTFPLIVVVDDADFTARTLNNFLWVTFTRANPATDISGFDQFIEHKHWGCRGPLVIDARIKPHHAAPLIEDPEVTKRVDQLAAPGGPLHGII
ncbi:UbiD family decarboxylase [Thalassoroseus pseudoceratinae]|uniref:UbiD family decarboxylase n=1 Tax=Thalassoroseus pseudoceratinae TaxID=2713176 RepID=UPI00141DA423|nr:UbiD family decarboxylase [Thalassoroseus pseudoceratinae]